VINDDWLINGKYLMQIWFFPIECIIFEDNFWMLQCTILQDGESISDGN